MEMAQAMLPGTEPVWGESSAVITQERMDLEAVLVGWRAGGAGGGAGRGEGT